MYLIPGCQYKGTVPIWCQFGVGAQTGFNTESISNTYQRQKTVIFLTRIEIEIPYQYGTLL